MLRRKSMRSALRPLLVLATAAALAAGTARATEWPMYAGGPRRLFVNPAETQITPANVAGLRVKWKAQAGAAITASPSVATIELPGEGATQVVFFPSWDQTLYAVRLRDGSEVWRFALPDYPGATYPNAASLDVSLVDGEPRVHFASEQYLYSIDARTGMERWRFAAGTGCLAPPGLCGFDNERNEIESSPLVADGKVFFGMDVNDREGGKGGFYAVDARDGRLAWFFDLESGMTCQPDPGDDIRRYDGYHSEEELGLPAGFFATRRGCNHPRSRNGCGNVWSSAAYDAGRRLLFTASSNCDTDTNPATLRPDPPMPPYDEAIFALRLDGTPAWRWRPREVDNADLAFGAVPNLFTITVGGAPRDVVGIGNKDGTYYVIDRDGVNQSTGVRWDDADPTQLPYWRTNVVRGGAVGGIIATAAVDEASRRVFFSTGPGSSVFSPQRPTVHALDFDTGAIVWQNIGEANADASFAPTSVIPGVVFVGGAASGNLRSYDAATGAKLGATSITFVLAAAPAVVDGHVLVGGGVGEQSGDPSDPADSVSRIPQSLTALCVPGSPACDEDQDGVDFPEDCDDRDPLRSPRAREVGGNEVDEDCDGVLAGPKDACLTGGSAPQDQRDIDAIVAAAETACPCASFGGRGAYQRCMRRLVRDAITGGTLRRTCKRVVKRSASTCGRRNAVICCTRRLSSGKLSCGATREARCADTRKLHRAVAVGATTCLDTDCDAVVPVTTTTTTTPGSSTTTSTLPPSWKAIQATVIGPRCAGCHGGSGGLSGLEGCVTGHSVMVGVPSSQLPSMKRVEPGDPDRSWLVQKLDGTQNQFDAQCVGGFCGSAMPPGAVLLTPEEREAIRAWIRAGAQNDCP
jgi:polyvinyl alcohol dehydrogenase (cytochrome)